ncbi:MAG TPA: hypothetical protein VGZ32_23640 [Actinocrinis sp.]|jgi:hypothetical protein|uniref:hypothetical protein n=1 Tax=Actinocrinis sp. TaxID=1920516 RepID=UPI002DDDB278|nr:hypothetical protein [Actinocrinis sp.]HEV3173361.1 hypothetical protein [Actinocrinis sp.]
MRRASPATDIPGRTRIALSFACSKSAVGSAFSACFRALTRHGCQRPDTTHPPGRQRQPGCTTILVYTLNNRSPRGLGARDSGFTARFRQPDRLAARQVEAPGALRKNTATLLIGLIGLGCLLFASFMIAFAR